MMATNPLSNEDHSADVPSNIQPLPFHCQPVMQEVNGGHGTAHTDSQEEAQLPEGIPDSAGNLHSVVLKSGTVGVTERESIDEAVSMVYKRIDEQEAEYNLREAEYRVQVDKIVTEKVCVENQLAHVNYQLQRSIENGFTKDQQLHSKDEQLRGKDEQLRVKDEQLRSKDEQLCGKDEQLRGKDEQLHSKDEQLRGKDEQLRGKDEQLRSKDEQLCGKDEQLRGKDEQLRSKDEQLCGKVMELKVKNEQISAKDAQLQSKNKELGELAERLTTQSANLSKELKRQEMEHDNIMVEFEKQKKKLKEELLNELKKLLNETLQKELRTIVAKQEEDRQHQLILEISRLEGELTKDKPHENTAIGTSIPANPEEIEIAAPKATFSTEQDLGGGAFGKVYAGLFDGKPCAVKILNEVAQSLISGLPTGGGNTAISQRAKNSFKKEGDCLKRIEHENIVKLYDIRVYPKGDYPVLIMEKMECSLTYYFTSDGQNIGEEVQLSFSCNIASALEYLCQNGIIHRDLCSNNILLDRKGPIPIAKVSDFGMSRILKNFDRMSTTLTALDGLRTAYYPPELQEDPESYDESIDIFMFGVILTQIAHRIPEIKSKKRRLKLIEELSRSHILRKFIMHCVKDKKNERPSAKELHTDLKDLYERLQQKRQD